MLTATALLLPQPVSPATPATVATPFPVLPAANQNVPVAPFRLRSYLPTAYSTSRGRPLRGAYLP